MRIHELKKPEGSTKAPKRIGRGQGTGQGTTAGRGMNGQNSRSGGGVRLGFEGGQMPLYRRLLREASTTNGLRNMPKSTLRISTDSKTVQRLIWAYCSQQVLSESSWTDSRSSATVNSARSSQLRLRSSARALSKRSKRQAERQRSSNGTCEDIL